MGFEDRASILDFAREVLVENIRYNSDRLPHTSMMILDSKTIQNSDIPEEKGYDSGKKSGIKLHIAVDTLGLLNITTANIAY